MKFKNSSKWFCFVVVLGLSFSYSCSRNGDIDDFADLKGQFKNPPKEYRSVPFWVWNNKMTKAEIDRMLSAYKEQGFGGVFLCPRYGLVTEYLSSDWYELVQYSLAKAKELDLDLWLYDENAYPSGFAGGHVPEQMPESYNQGIAIKPERTSLLDVGASDAFIVLCREGENFRDITTIMSDFFGRPGDYVVYRKLMEENSDWFAGHTYVDLLKSGVTQKFLEVSMGGYQKRCSEAFGKNIMGVFTDEPHINVPLPAIRWTPDLFPEFKKTYGYDLVPRLLSLSEPVGDFRKVRHDYYQLLLRLFIDRWAKPSYDFYTENNLQLTGHYWEHEWPRIGPGPDNMAMSAWQHMPGIDLLFRKFDEESPRAQFGNIRIVKEVASIARQFGRKRVLAEMYGGAGYGLSFKDQKRLGDWAFVHGINFMTQHLGLSSISGCRKYDYPPVFSPAAPWWGDYKILNDYFARLSLALTSGKEENEILLMEPTTSIWMYSSYLGDTDEAQQIAQGFQNLVTGMSKAQVEFDLGCEEVLKTQAKVKKGQLVVGECSYSTLIVPPFVENIETETFKLLKEFVRRGGTLISASMPNRLNGKVDFEVSEFFAGSEVKHFDTGDLKVLQSLIPTQKIRYEQSWPGMMYHKRRTLDDGELFFFMNADTADSESMRVYVEGESAVLMDPMNGKTYVQPYDKEKGCFDVELAPFQSKLIFVSHKSLDARWRPQQDVNGLIPSSGNMMVYREQDNVLAIDYVDLNIAGKCMNGIPVLEAADRIFMNAGFADGNPWFSKIQFKNRLVVQDTFTTKGFQLTYRFYTDPSLSGNKFKIAVERPWLYTIRLNGKVLNTHRSEYMLDKDLVIIPTEGAVIKGENKIELIAKHFSLYAEAEPVYVLGDFDVSIKNKRFVLVKSVPHPIPSSWKDSGAPFYPFTVSYRKEYKIPAGRYVRFEVEAPKWKGTVAEVWVNGKKQGLFVVEPYRMDVSKAIQPGRNLVEVKVVGGLDNLFGPFHKDPTGAIDPLCWRYVVQPQSADQYHFVSYGLFSDFELHGE